MRLFAQAGMPRPRPPAPGECGEGMQSAGAPPLITSPLAGATYQLRDRRLATDSIALVATADGDVRDVYWFADGAFIGAARPSAALPWVPGRPGEFSLSVVDDHGRSDARSLGIEIAP
jgi:penicillin-binding protein 1C